MKAISNTCKEMLIELAIIRRQIQVSKMIKDRKENTFRAQVFDKISCTWVEEV